MRRKIKKPLTLICLVLAISLCGCSDNSDINSGYTLLNSSHIDTIKSIIKENTENSTSVNLVKNISDDLPYIKINFPDKSICYSLDGNQCKSESTYDVFITMKLEGNSDSIDILCGNYNGYFIAKERAEYEIGELSNFYYDNFYTENTAYEAIATDANGQMYLIADDCTIKMSGVEFILSESSK